MHKKLQRGHLRSMMRCLMGVISSKNMPLRLVNGLLRAVKSLSGLNLVVLALRQVLLRRPSLDGLLLQLLLLPQNLQLLAR